MNVIDDVRIDSLEQEKTKAHKLVCADEKNELTDNKKRNFLGDIVDDLDGVACLSNN